MSWEMLGPAAIHPDPLKIRGGRPIITADDVRLALGGLSERPFLFGMAAFLGHRGSLDRIEQLLVWDVIDRACDEHWGSGKDREGKSTGEMTSEDIRHFHTLCSLMLFEVISARSRHDTYAHEEALPAGSASVLCPECRGRGFVSRMATLEEKWASENAAVDVHALYHDAVKTGATQSVRNALAAQRNAAERLHYQLVSRSIDSQCELCSGRGRFLLANPKRAMMLGVSLRTWERRWNGRYAELMEIPREWEAIAIGHVRKKLRLDS
jgi:hypothetical protein